MNNPEMGSIDLEAKKEEVVKTIERILESENHADEKMIIAVAQSYVMARMLDEGVLRDEVEYATGGHSARFRQLWNQGESNGSAFGVNEIERMRTEGVGKRLEEIYRIFTSSHVASSEQMAA